jgi:hypothetical protein
MDILNIVRFPIPAKPSALQEDDIVSAVDRTVDFILQLAGGRYFYECEICEKSGRSCGCPSFSHGPKIPDEILEHLRIHVGLYHE